nr:phosphatidylinositol N-acetylglucosaminyltransferase subunit A [Ipomoea batatas]
MGSKQHSFKSHHQSSKPFPLIRSSTIVAVSLFLASLAYLFFALKDLKEPFFWAEESYNNNKFSGDLRDAKFAWNKLCFGATNEKLKLAVFSKSWPIGSDPGGMERHASTLYTALAARGHEIHVFTVPSDKWPHENLHDGNLHVYFAPNEYGRLNCTQAFEIFHKENKKRGGFDYVHTESVSLPHWRTKMVPKVAVTWHGIWYEIMHSKLFQELLENPRGDRPAPMLELQEAMPRLIDEIRFFPSYSEHICISDSAGEVLVNIYQLPKRNVHIILNGVDESRFMYDRKSGEEFRQKHGVPSNATLILGVAGRLVKDKGHPLLFEAFSSIINRYPGVFLLVAGSGPWGNRYAELEKNVKVLGALDPSELSKFYNALDLFVNPTLRPQGLDLTLMEAMHCGKPVLTPNFPSISRSVVLNEGFGYTFSPNVRSFVEALEFAIADGPEVLQKKGMVCRKYAVSMFTATKMALAYERFFLCMKNSRYCHYPLPTDC